MQNDNTIPMQKPQYEKPTMTVYTAQQIRAAIGPAVGFSANGIPEDFLEE